MRRSDHPSRPSAITCCRFSALKTLPIPAAGVQPTAQVNVSAPGAALAGFQVSINGRFWVSTEASWTGHTSWRRSARQNRTGSRTTAANSSAPGALTRIVRLRHHRLNYRQRDQRFAVLAGVLHRLNRFPEAAVGEPGGGLELVPETGPL